MECKGNLTLHRNNDPIPKGLIAIQGDLDITGRRDIKAIPPIPIGGSIYAAHSGLNSWDVNRQVVNGNLDIRHTAIDWLPEAFHVTGYLFGDHGKMKDWPPRMRVDGRFSPNGQTKIMPPNLQVGTLSLSNSDGLIFAPGFVVTGDLDLTSATRLSLCQGLRVCGNLGMTWCAGIGLPEDIYVGGNFNAIGSDLRCWPRQGEIKGNAYLFGSPLSHLELPRGFVVRGKIFRHVIGPHTSDTNVL